MGREREEGRGEGWRGGEREEGRGEGGGESIYYQYGIDSLSLCLQLSCLVSSIEIAMNCHLSAALGLPEVGTLTSLFPELKVSECV